MYRNYFFYNTAIKQPNATAIHKPEVLLISACYNIIYGSQLFIAAISDEYYHDK